MVVESDGLECFGCGQFVKCVIVFVCVFLSLPLYHQFVKTIMCFCLRVACCLVLLVSVLSRFASRVACKILLSLLLCMNAHKHPRCHGFQRENRIRPLASQRTREKVPPFAETTRRQTSKRAKQDTDKASDQEGKRRKHGKKVSFRRQDSRNFFPRIE